MELLLVGRVWRPHGVRGEVKVIPETDDPGRFAELEVVYLGADGENAEPFEIESSRIQHAKRGPTVVLKLAGIDGREDVEALRGRSVYAREEDLPPLEEGEFFLHDLVDLEVVDEAGERIGRVKDVLSLPAHDTLVVRREGRPDALVPVVDEFVLEIDLDAGRLVVRPIEGLLE